MNLDIPTGSSGYSGPDIISWCEVGEIVLASVHLNKSVSTATSLLFDLEPLELFR